MVAAPFSMIRLPTTVEPVNEIRSTFGDNVSSSPTKWSDAVTTLTTPAGMSVFSAISRPSRVALNGVLGAGLSTTVLPVPSAWPELVEGDLEREVPRHDRADHPYRLPPYLAGGQRAGEADHLVTQVRFPGVLVDQPGRVLQPVFQRGVQLGAEGDRPRRADLEDELLAQLFLLLFDRVVQLQQTALAQLLVGRPVGLVEGAPGGVDGPVHVLLRRVGNLAERLLGRRVDVREGAGLAVDELAVDHHLRLEPDLYSVSHICSALF